MSNLADIFTVSPSLLRDLRAVLNGLLSRIQQYCFVRQSASLSRWCIGVLGAANTVYVALSGTLRSIRDCARLEAFVDYTSASRCLIVPSLVLSYKAFLFTPRMLCWCSIPREIGCRLALDSFSYLPPSSGQLLGVRSVAAEEEYGMGGSSYHFMRSLYSGSPVSRFSPGSLSHSFSQTRSINNSSRMGSPLINSSS